MKKAVFLIFLYLPIKSLGQSWSFTLIKGGNLSKSVVTNKIFYKTTPNLSPSFSETAFQCNRHFKNKLFVGISYNSYNSNFKVLQQNKLPITIDNQSILKYYSQKFWQLGIKFGKERSFKNTSFNYYLAYLPTAEFYPNISKDKFIENSFLIEKFNTQIGVGCSFQSKIYKNIYGGFSSELNAPIIELSSKLSDNINPITLKMNLCITKIIGTRKTSFKY